MSAKRPRDSEVPDNHPSIPPPPVGFRQPIMQSSSQMDARDALPTLTNWGGGRRGSQVEGSAVVSNARLTNEQRSTIQKSVCVYFLQNKSVLLNIIACRSRLLIFAPLGVERARIAHTATTPLCPSRKTCKSTTHFPMFFSTFALRCVFHFAGNCKNGHNCMYVTVLLSPTPIQLYCCLTIMQLFTRRKASTLQVSVWPWEMRAWKQLPLQPRHSFARGAINCSRAVEKRRNQSRKRNHRKLRVGRI